MLTKSTWLHLRIPFSFFLMPVFFFALALSPNLHGARLGWVLFIIHFLLYPASNGYNSYFDKDEKSIGGLKNPPPVKKELYVTSLLFDGAALVLGWLYVSPFFALLLMLYGLVSKAYSHPSIRLKKYPFWGWITVALFQGFFTLLMCYAGINKFELENIFSEKVVFAGLLTSAMLFGTYPMTQIYQHEEDARRGDKTISLLLGVRGTFYFTLLFFSLAGVGFTTFFAHYYSMHFAYVFLLSQLPVAFFFLIWFGRVYKDASLATHRPTMWLNFLSAATLNGFFIYLFLKTSHILQL